MRLTWKHMYLKYQSASRTIAFSALHNMVNPIMSSSPSLFSLRSWFNVPRVELKLNNRISKDILDSLREVYDQPSALTGTGTKFDIEAGFDQTSRPHQREYICNTRSVISKQIVITSLPLSENKTMESYTNSKVRWTLSDGRSGSWLRHACAGRMTRPLVDSTAKTRVPFLHHG